MSKKTKAVYFRDEEGFVLTFPADDELYDVVAGLSSAQIRQYSGFETFQALQAAAGGTNVRAFLRERLREGVPRQNVGEAPLRDVLPREFGWPERDHTAAVRTDAVLAAHAPEARRVLDPFAGSALYPVVSAQRGAESFWCEISPVYRFLAGTRFRALYRDREERARLADRLRELSLSVAAKLDRAPESSASPIDRLRSLADEGHGGATTIERDLLRASVVSLLVDEEEVTADSVSDQLLRVAQYIAAEREMTKFPNLVANDAADLGGMRSLEADVLLTNPPHLSGIDYFPAAAEGFLNVESAGERSRAVASTPQTQTVLRGRATPLQREKAMRELQLLPKAQILNGYDSLRVQEVIASIAGLIAGIKEPGKAAIAISYFIGMARTFAAVEHHLTDAATAIIDVSDSFFGGTLIHNSEHLAGLLGIFGFEPVRSETVAMRALPMRDDAPEDERHKTHRLLVMKRGSRRRGRTQKDRGWAVWA